VADVDEVIARVKRFPHTATVADVALMRDVILRRARAYVDELRMLEGDLTVAVHEATTARAELAVLRANRDAALELCQAARVAQSAPTWTPTRGALASFAFDIETLLGASFDAADVVDAEIMCGGDGCPGCSDCRREAPRLQSQVDAVEALLDHADKVSPNAVIPASIVRLALTTGQMPPWAEKRVGQVEVPVHEEAEADDDDGVFDHVCGPDTCVTEYGDG
jgi:hypothetical protein